MAIAHLLRPLGLTFSCLGLIQGILWTTLSILGILVDSDVIKPVERCTFLNSSDFIFFTRDIEGFLTFMIVYLILSVYWGCLSTYQFWLFQKKKFGRLRIILIQWGNLTAVISLVDLSLSTVVYKMYSKLNTDSGAEDRSVYSSIVILMIACRGSVIWIINVASVIMTVFFIRYLKKEEIRLSRYNNHVKPIQAFDHLQPGPSSWFAEVANDDDPRPRMSHLNPSFLDDEGIFIGDPYTNDNASTGYNSQFNYDDDNNIARYIDEEFSYIDQSNNSSQYHTEGEWNRSSNCVAPPRKTERIKILDMELIPDEELVPPTIPPPDYTPPSTPMVRARSVLKSNPIYN